MHGGACSYLEGIGRKEKQEAVVLRGQAKAVEVGSGLAGFMWWWEPRFRIFTFNMIIRMVNVLVC